jgi:hypothetical protein
MISCALSKLPASSGHVDTVSCAAQTYGINAEQDPDEVGTSADGASVLAKVVEVCSGIDQKVRGWYALAG